MRVGIIADIHDHIDKLQQALQALHSTDTILCCGDLCSPFIIEHLGQGFSDDIHIVFGNNDADLFRITSKVARHPNIKLHGEFCELKLDNKKFAMNHFDNIARALAASNDYDVVCFGHNHRYEVSSVGQTLLINPGEVMGELTGQASCVSYDTRSGQVEKINL